MQNSLGEKLRSSRKKQELTLNKLALLTNYSVSYLSQIERNIITPSLSALKKIAGALNLHASDLMFGDFKINNDTEAVVVKKNKRKTITFNGSNVKYELITPDFKRNTSVLWLVASPGANSVGHTSTPR